MLEDNLLPITESLQASVISPVHNFSISSFDRNDKGSLHEVNLRGADLSGMDLRNINLSGVDLRGAILSGADLRSVTLSGADLRGAILHRAILSNATLSRANLQGADLSNVILSGASLWDANLSGASLERANLWDANLSGANLTGANLSSAILSSTDLRDADLSRASLWGANLGGANLSRANLTNVDLSNADLQGANLWNTNLSNVDFSSAMVEDTRFGQNLGISDAQQTELRQRGAIFITDPGDRLYSLPFRSEGKSSLSQADWLDEEAVLPALPSTPDLYLPQETGNYNAIAPDEYSFPMPEIGFPEEPTQFQREQTVIDTDTYLQTQAGSIPKPVGDSWGYADIPTVGVPLEAMQAAIPVEERSDRYLSPIAREAAAIRDRRSRLKSRRNHGY